MARRNQASAPAAPAPQAEQLIEVEAIEPIKAGRKWHKPGAVFPVPAAVADELKAIGHACEPGSRPVVPQAPAAAETTEAAEPPQGELLPSTDPT